MSATKKQTVKPYNIWMDPLVPDKEFSHEEFIKHLKDAYGIDANGMKASRSLLMHMDGANFYKYIWEWEIAGKKFTQNTCALRSGENAAMWGGDGE